MTDDIGAWFAGKLPAGWSAGPPEVNIDGDEILVTVSLPDVELAAGTSEEGRAAARAARVDRFRVEVQTVSLERFNELQGQ